MVHRRTARCWLPPATSHQAKSRKWDVVVGSLSGPDLDTDRVGRNLAECYGLYPGEQAGRIANLDRIRRRHIAFTKARNLLVLTSSGRPKARFSPIWKGAARWPCVDRDSLARRRFGIAGGATTGGEIDHLTGWWSAWCKQHWWSEARP